MNSIPFLENLPHCLYLKDLDSRYLWCNYNVAKLSNLQFPSDLIGKSGYELYENKCADILRANDLEVMTAGVDLQFEETIVTLDNLKKTFITRKTPLRDQKGNIIGIAGTSTEISPYVERDKFSELTRIGYFYLPTSAPFFKNEFIINRLVFLLRTTF